MKRWNASVRRWNSIHNQFLFFIILFLIIPLFLSMFWVFKPLEKVIEQKIGKATEEALYQVDFHIERFLHEMLKSAVDISTNSNVINMLQYPNELSYYDKLRLTDSVINKLYTTYLAETHITLLDRKGNWISNKVITPELYDHIVSSDWYKELIKEPMGIRWLTNDTANYIYLDKKRMVTLAKTITNQQTNENIGIVLLSVNESDISSFFEKLEGEAALLNEQGGFVAGALSEGFLMPGTEDSDNIWESMKGQFISQKGNSKSIISYDTITATGWKLVQVIPHDKVFKEIFDIRRTSLLTTGFIVLAFLLLAVSIAYSVSKPLKLLNKRMQEIEKNDFNSSLSLSGPKEISTVIESYNHMARQIRELLGRLKEEYEQKEDMRFRALQAQINPHFILNTLNNIKWMAYIRNDREVGEMLSSLGSMMEGSIGRGDKLITLKEEMEYVKHYITLMKLRYNEKLSVDFAIPESLYHHEVIKFMLQPIVENSIIHGIEQLDRDGVIRVEAEAKDERLVIRVIDNGLGIEPEQLLELQQSLLNGVTDSKSIGVRNVHERIRLQYGEGYGLRFESTYGEMTKVELELPLRSTERGGGMTC
ncbi:sensor histidine kinase [Paenibacillus silviterrae]|uniref:sensor histidine kinase n=1 Tax=Paenibacillus silviterrae TaxID=3242194 RepID=UPI0025437D22|nr:sensor histidine kinase [Paenibacillus chinjuensis]